MLQGGLDLGRPWRPQQVQLNLSVWDAACGNLDTVIFHLCVSLPNFQVPSRENLVDQL